MKPPTNPQAPPPRPTEVASHAVGGARHWWWQRVSAIALVPLTVWFVFAMLNHIGDAQQNAVAWVAQPGVALALCAYLAALFFHSYLGMQVIMEDYVSSAKNLRITLWAMKAVHALGALVALGSVLRIVMQ